jgi:hypothetical protein
LVSECVACVRCLAHAHAHTTTTHTQHNQVLLLPSYGLAAPRPPPRSLQALKLPDPDPLLVHLASEAAAYFRGLQVHVCV